MAYGEGGVDGEGRRWAAGAVVATAVVIGGEGGGFGRRGSADLAGGGEAWDARRGEEEKRGDGVGAGLLWGGARRWRGEGGRRRPGGVRRPWRRGDVPERDSRSGRRGAALLGWAVIWPGSWAGPVGGGRFFY